MYQFKFANLVVPQPDVDVIESRSDDEVDEAEQPQAPKRGIKMRRKKQQNVEAASAEAVRTLPVKKRKMIPVVIPHYATLTSTSTTTEQPITEEKALNRTEEDSRCKFCLLS